MEVIYNLFGSILKEGFRCLKVSDLGEFWLKYFVPYKKAGSYDL